MKDMKDMKDMKTKTAQPKELFDCMITCGELDPEWYGHYKEGTVIQEVARHNVTEEEAKAWVGSLECLKWVQELERLGREKFGADHWMKWSVSYFWTIASDACHD